MGQPSTARIKKTMSRTWPKTKLKRQNHARIEVEKRGFRMAHSCKIRPRPLRGVPQKIWAQRSRQTVQMRAERCATSPIFLSHRARPHRAKLFSKSKRKQLTPSEVLDRPKVFAFLRNGHQKWIYLGEIGKKLRSDRDLKAFRQAEL